MIYYFAPYDARGLGYAYNDHCALVPGDYDWICLMDLDVMFFSSQRIGERFEKIIAQFHPHFSMFTCVANRAFESGKQQLHNIRDERDLVKIKQRADWQLTHREGRVEELTGGLSGHLMLFPKWLWKLFPFSTVSGSKNAPGHHILGIDTDFKNRLRAAGHRIGLIHEVMATHFYRMDGKSSVRCIAPPK